MILKPPDKSNDGHRFLPVSWIWFRKPVLCYSDNWNFYWVEFPFIAVGFNFTELHCNLTFSLFHLVGLVLFDFKYKMFLWQGWWPASDDETIDSSGPNTRAEKHRFDVNRKLAMQTVKNYAEGLFTCPWHEKAWQALLLGNFKQFATISLISTWAIILLYLHFYFPKVYLSWDSTI